MRKIKSQHCDFIQKSYGIFGVDIVFFHNFVHHEFSFQISEDFSVFFESQHLKILYGCKIILSTLKGYIMV